MSPKNLHVYHVPRGCCYCWSMGSSCKSKTLEIVCSSDSQPWRHTSFIWGSQAWMIFRTSLVCYDIPPGLRIANLAPWFSFRVWAWRWCVGGGQDMTHNRTIFGVVSNCVSVDMHSFQTIHAPLFWESVCFLNIHPSAYFLLTQRDTKVISMGQLALEESDIIQETSKNIFKNCSQCLQRSRG